MFNIPVEERVSELERMMMQTIWQSRQTEISIATLSKEMKEFKDEMKEFKDEMKEFKDEMKEFKDEMKESTMNMNKRWGDLARKMGTIAEDIVAPGIPALIRTTNGQIVKDLSVRRRFEDEEGNTAEYDIIAVTETAVFVVDVKSDYNRVQFLQEFQDDQLSKLTTFLPELADKMIRGCIASFSLNKNIVNKATRMGLLAISMGGEYLQFANSDEILK